MTGSHIFNNSTHLSHPVNNNIPGLGATGEGRALCWNLGSAPVTGRLDLVTEFTCFLCFTQHFSPCKGYNTDKKKASYFLDGVQQAQMVTKVMRRKMPPVERMI